MTGKTRFQVQKIRFSSIPPERFKKDIPDATTDLGAISSKNSRLKRSEVAPAIDRESPSDV